MKQYYAEDTIPVNYEVEVQDVKYYGACNVEFKAKAQYNRNDDLKVTNLDIISLEMTECHVIYKDEKPPYPVGDELHYSIAEDALVQDEEFEERIIDTIENDIGIKWYEDDVEAEQERAFEHYKTVVDYGF